MKINAVCKSIEQAPRLYQFYDLETRANIDVATAAVFADVGNIAHVPKYDMRLELSKKLLSKKSFVFYQLPKDIQAVLASDMRSKL